MQCSPLFSIESWAFWQCRSLKSYEIDLENKFAKETAHLKPKYLKKYVYPLLSPLNLYFTYAHRCFGALKTEVVDVICEH
jgi:hypothetical protein